MKGLVVFVDMFRPNLLNVCNTSVEKTNIDYILEKWGGTIYTKCYTPSPDTPRSNACLWSGKYPGKNGCDTRIKYPKYYMKNIEESLLDRLEGVGVSLNIYLDKASEQCGVLPRFYDKANYSNGRLLEEYLEQLEIEENSFTYISLEDYHEAIYDFGANRKAVKKGNELIGDALTLISNKIGTDIFDFIIVFSDHGFKFDSEQKRMGIYQQLDDDRTNIFMYIREKGDCKLKRNSRLSTIMDIYPTVCNYYGIDYNCGDIDGISVNDKKKRDFILIEDHKEFTVSLCQTIEYWGIRDENGLSTIDCRGQWTSEIKDKEILEKYKKIITEESHFFAENYKAQKIRDYYDTGREKSLYACYSNGERRKKHYTIKEIIKNIVQRAIAKLKKVLY